MIKCHGICSRCGKCMNKNEDKNKANLLVYPRSFKTHKGSGTGISVDIGTTTLAGNLWDLERGEQLATSSRKNSQGNYGRDVISRIDYAMESLEHLEILRKAVIGDIKIMMTELLEKGQRHRESLSKILLCGNTAMSHIVSGFSPGSLAVAPFEPAYEGTLHGKASDYDFDLDCEVVVVPNIAGHVGGDITAGLVATEFLHKKGLNLFIDVGTNGEMVLMDGDKLLTCSTAAGPAFETIPGRLGSNVVDILAKMLRMGLIDRSGKLRMKEENMPPWAYLKQEEIRELQLAKGAIRAGIEVLLNSVGKAPKDLDEILLAGSFGNNIDPESGIEIGLFPMVDSTIIVPSGNAASAGASMILTNEKYMKEAEAIPKKILHVELAEVDEFQKIFLESMGF